MSPLPRLLAFASCGVAGYFGTAMRTPLSPTTPAPVFVAKVASPAQDSLTAEWRQLRARRGDDAAALAQLYGEVKDIADPFRRRAFRSTLIAEWAARDPLAALAFLEKNDDAKVDELLREWLQHDPRAAIDRLLAGGEKGQDTLREMLPDVARTAPALLAEVVSALPRGGYNFSAREAFEIFAKNDPAAARTAAESVSGPLRGQALAGVARMWAERDGPAAIAWAQALAAGAARDDALRAALLGWAKSDPVAALDHLDIVPPRSGELFRASNHWIMEAEISSRVIGEAAMRDWDGTIQWLREHPGKLTGWESALSGSLSNRLNADLGGTMRFLENSGIPSLESALLFTLLYSAYNQHDNIWNWLDQQQPSDFTRKVRGQLLHAIAQNEPDAALAFLEKVPDSPENRGVLEDGTRNLIGGENAMNRFDEYLAKASPKMRALLIETALVGYNDIGADAPLWAERIAELPADRQEKAIAGLARNWAAVDPQAAVQWALAQPDPANGAAALNAAAKNWAAGDIRDAAAWINAQPAGANRDAATRGLVSGLAYNDPESAWTWALSIQTPAQKIGALQSAYEELRKKDFATAEHLLQNANLPPADAKTVREKPVK